MVLFVKDPHTMSFPSRRSFLRENFLILRRSMKGKARRSPLQDLMRRWLRNARKDPEDYTNYWVVEEWSGLIISLKVTPFICLRPIQHRVCQRHRSFPNKQKHMDGLLESCWILSSQIVSPTNINAAIVARILLQIKQSCLLLKK